MKRYEAYKAVQPLWNMTFPKHWEVFPLYSIAKEKSICNYTELELLSVYLDAGVVPFSKRTEKRTNATSKDLSKYQRVDPADFVLNNQQAWRGSVGESKPTAITSPAYIVLSMNDQLTTEYANYLFRSAIMVDQYLVRSKGVGSIQRNLYWQELKCASVLVPPRDEQDQIVRYLDWQVSKINHLIHSYQKQIKLLEERKVALIDHAVTKGIDSKAPMKSISGNWMGAIPAHWRMIPSKRVFVEGKERRRNGDISATASQKYGIISQEEYMRRENRRIVVANQSLDDWKHVEPGNFVISLRSFQGGIELCEITGCVTWHYIVLLPQEMVCTQYFKWLLKSKSYIKALQGTSEFIRDGQDLRYSNFVKVDLPLIPMDEQIEIAEYITAEVAKIDNALPTFQKEIELLREYRTRLISDVVTGKIDVRDVVIPDYTPEDDTEIDTDDNGGDAEEVAEDAE